MESRICGNCFRKMENESGTCPHCGYNASENGMYYISALPIGTTLSGKYRIGRVLGQGGFGITYLSMDCIEKKKVAIKEFFPNRIAVRKKDLTVTTNSSKITYFEESLDRFLEEAGTLTHLGSVSGVAHVLGFFRENGTAYSVMEYVDGESLKERIERDGELSCSDALKLLKPVMETLIGVHKKKIIHQDIAPDNILIAKDGTVKLIDFGAAKFDIGHITQDVHSVVKQGFTPFEMYSYQRDATAVSDVYSMAATLYYAITEHCPPDALSRQSYDMLVAPKEYNTSVPEYVEAILLKALAVKDEDRYQTIREFYKDLYGITDDPGIQITFYESNRKKISQQWYKKGAKIKVPQNPKSHSDKLFTYEFSGWNPVVNPIAEKHADYYAQFNRKIKPVYPLVTTGILVCLIIAVLLGVRLKGVGKSDGSADETTAPTVVTEQPRPTENTDMHITPTELPDLIPAVDIVSHAAASSTFDGDGVSHGVYNLLDGDVKTNWTEGVSGQGIGEYVEFTFNQECNLKSISVQSGVAYREDLFEKNSRPRSVTLAFSDGRIMEYTLADTSVLQEIIFVEPISTSSLKVTINSVYPGSKWEETAISEISFNIEQDDSGRVDPVPELTVHTPISAGADDTFAILKDGSVVSLGQNDFKQGNVSSWKNIVDVDTGWTHSVGLRSDGLVFAIGSNSHGQCETTQWTDIVDVDAGWLHTVAVRSDGTVVATGNNQYGQCDVSTWKDIVAVSAGFTHTVGLKSDGTLVSVGENSDKECNVSGISGVTAIHAGVDHTVALHSDGTVTAVGGNDYGECDVADWQGIVAVSASSSYTMGLKSDGSIVVAGSGLPKSFNPASWSDIVAIAAGQDHAVGLRSDGTLVSAGRNRFGECNVENLQNIILPNEAFTESPVDPIAFEEAKPIAISAGCRHTAVLRDDGTVIVAGANDEGQCNVSHWKNISAVSAGEYHTLGLKNDGTVLSTGQNKYSQCNVSDWSGITAIAAGTLHSVGLCADGTVVAVGENKDGQCNVSGWRDIIAVEAGYKHTVGLRSDGTVVATGVNVDGRCNVSDWRDIVAISSDGYHTVGLKSDGTVVAAGRNKDGQCNVSEWSDIIDISAEGRHTVGLLSTGTVVAVGSNDAGMCNVSDWSDVVAISAGNDHTTGLKADGSIYAIGENHSGQCNFLGWTVLGTGSASYFENTRTGVITGNKVVIREEADSTSKKVGSYKKGDYILALVTKADRIRTENDWVNGNWVVFCQ